jgi:hypothetical protein
VIINFQNLVDFELSLIVTKLSLKTPPKTFRVQELRLTTLFSILCIALIDKPKSSESLDWV